MRRKRKGKEKEEQLALASALSKIVLSSTDICKIGRDITLELSRLMPVNLAVVGLIEKSTGTLRIFPLSPDLDSEWKPGDSLPLDGTPVAWLAQHKKAWLEPDLSKESLFWTGTHWLDKGIKAIVYMPLFYGGEVFGSLITGSDRPYAYEERELKLLKYSASQLAVPVRHSEKFIPIIEGRQISVKSIEDWMNRTEQTLRELSDATTGYTVHLESHSADIQDLREVIEDLKRNITEQNKYLADLINTMEEMISEAETATVSEPDITPAPEKDVHVPDFYHNHRRGTSPRTLAEKQRELFERRSRSKTGPSDSKPTVEKGSGVPSESARYRRQGQPPP